MAFDTYETSDGSPVEIMSFSNGVQSFRSANTVRDILVGAQIYQATAYTITPFAQSKDTDDNNRTMKVGNEFPVIELYNGAPTSASTRCSIWRFHNDDPAKQLQSVWTGRIVAINYENDEVEILLQPITNGTESTPPDTFSGLCNSFLFQSPGCNLNRDAFRHIGTVSSITNGGLNFIIGGLRAQAAALDAIVASPTGPLTSGELDIYWQGGYIQTAAGELRDIVEGNVGGDPDEVRVIVPFRGLQVSDGLNVYAGCDLSRFTCHHKYNNVINFQGYPDIPEVDPANTELPVGTRTSESAFTTIQGP